MIQRAKTIAILLLIAIVTMGVVGITIGVEIQTVQAQCLAVPDPGADDCGHGQSLQHDTHGDAHSPHA